MATLEPGFNYVHLSQQGANALRYYWDENSNEFDFVGKFTEQIKKVREALLQEVTACKCPARYKGKVVLTLDIGLTGWIDNQETPVVTIRGYQLSFAPVATVLCTDLPLGRGAKLGVLDLTNPKNLGSKFTILASSTEGRGAKWGRDKPS